MTWLDRAACREADPRLFDEPGLADRSSRGRTNACNRRLLAAIAVCRGCPVAGLCLAEAQQRKDDGVYGGRLLLRGVAQQTPVYEPLPYRPAPAPATPMRALRSRSTGGPTPIARGRCGTYAAARRHERRREPMDLPCRKALNAHEYAKPSAAVSRQGTTQEGAGK